MISLCNSISDCYIAELIIVAAIILFVASRRTRKVVRQLRYLLTHDIVASRKWLTLLVHLAIFMIVSLPPTIAILLIADSLLPGKAQIEVHISPESITSRIAYLKARVAPVQYNGRDAPSDRIQYPTFNAQSGIAECFLPIAMLDLSVRGSVLDDTASPLGAEPGKMRRLRWYHRLGLITMHIRL